MVFKQCYGWCRHRRTAVVHLISHCNARLQAMLPDPPPAEHHVPSSASPLAAAQAISNNSEASTSDAQMQHQKLPGLSPSQQLMGPMVTEQSSVQPRHISAAEEEGNERGSRADEQCAVQGPLVEAEAGQAVTAATLELMLAVLRGSEDTGLLHHLPHRQCAVPVCVSKIVNMTLALRVFVEVV